MSQGNPILLPSDRENNIVNSVDIYSEKLFTE